ncbi:MAG: hypothetical protein SO533_06340 [Eubacteriales bacterium]|nr:hypothetical protein [Eubacteriales bacterium]
MYEEDFDYTEDLYEIGLGYDDSRKPVKKVFYRWKDANDHTWVEMTGKEYYKFKYSDEAKGRFFIAEVDPFFEADTIIHEATEEDYKKWHAERTKYWQLRKDVSDSSETERNHRRKMPLISNVVSLDSPIDCDDDEKISLHDIVADPDSLFEDELIAKITVREMMKELLPEEKEVILALFFNNPDNLSERQVAQLIGVSQKNFNRRKSRAFKKFRKFLKLPVSKP